MMRTPIALILSTLVLTSSCVVIGTSDHEEVSGQFVSATTLDQIREGSSQEYVLSLLDEPSNKSVLSDGTEIWKWSYTASRKSSGHLLFLINSSNRTNTKHNTYVQFENGAVTKRWRD